MGDDADAQLTNFVNVLGVAIFGLIVLYTYMTSTVKDAEA
jgi:hypothetical protein